MTALLQVFLGSDSDLRHVRDAGLFSFLDEVLTREKYRLSICSAHRFPRELDAQVRNRVNQGARVFIGIAGEAPALPGAIAGSSHLVCPVIGVPLSDDSRALYTCTNTAPGVPVLVPGVGQHGVKKAGITAAQMLALFDDGIKERLLSYIDSDLGKKWPQFDIPAPE